METIYRAQSEPVYLRLYKAGTPTDATGTPVLVVKNSSGATILTPTVTRVDLGVYYAEIPWTMTQVADTLTLEWTYTLSGSTGTKISLLEVIDPYVSVDDLYQVAPDGTSYEEVKAAEIYSRLSIEAYCSQKFYPYRDTILAYGEGSNTMPITRRILAVDKIDINGENVYEDGVLNEWGYPLSISNTNRALRLDTGVESEFPELAGSGEFERGVRYDITGTYGWDQAPEAVVAAAKLLANDFFCKESVWKNRFVTSISASDWRIVFNAEASRGTGNATVDRILDPFTGLNWIVI
jgi:hypothetical protein